MPTFELPSANIKTQDEPYGPFVLDTHRARGGRCNQCGGDLIVFTVHDEHGGQYTWCTACAFRRIELAVGAVTAEAERARAGSSAAQQAADTSNDPSGAVQKTSDIA